MIERFLGQTDPPSPPHLFDQVPCEAVIGGELQADLGVDVRGGVPAAAHDQRELQTVGGSDLHRLSFHVSDTGAGTGLPGETAIQSEAQQVYLKIPMRPVSISLPLSGFSTATRHLLPETSAKTGN